MYFRKPTQETDKLFTGKSLNKIVIEKIDKTSVTPIVIFFEISFPNFLAFIYPVMIISGRTTSTYLPIGLLFNHSRYPLIDPPEPYFAAMPIITILAAIVKINNILCFLSFTFFKQRGAKTNKLPMIK